MKYEKNLFMTMLLEYKISRGLELGTKRREDEGFLLWSQNFQSLLKNLRPCDFFLSKIETQYPKD